MSRRRVAAKRDVLPDPKFASKVLAQFINVLMMHGKKSIAEKIVYGALDQVEKQLGASASKANDSKKAKEKDDDDGDGEFGRSRKQSIVVGDHPVLIIFGKALDKVRPSVEVRSRRVGGATYQVPVEVRSERSLALAMRWLVSAARGRGEKGMMLRLAAEIMDAIDGKGAAVKKCDDTHRMANANRAFAHFRWN